MHQLMLSPRMTEYRLTQLREEAATRRLLADPDRDVERGSRARKAITRRLFAAVAGLVLLAGATVAVSSPDPSTIAPEPIPAPSIRSPATSAPSRPHDLGGADGIHRPV